MVSNRYSDEDAEEAAKTIIEWLGYDTSHESLEATPKRMLSWLWEFRSKQPMGFEATNFNGVEYNEMVVVSGIPFTALCEHHMLPFTGTACVAYIPQGGTVLGLSKLARMVTWCAKRLQVQERMTRQICDYVSQAVESPDVGVVVTANHSCMSLRGAKALGSMTTTSALEGAFKENASTRAEFLALAR